MLAGLDGVRKLAQACAYLRKCAPAGARLAQAITGARGMTVVCPEITHKVNYDLI